MSFVAVNHLGVPHRETVTLCELAACCAMREEELSELVDYCALVPLRLTQPERTFSAEWVVPLRAAHQLQLDFDLDMFTVAILLGQLRRIDVLERQLITLTRIG